MLLLVRLCSFSEIKLRWKIVHNRGRMKLFVAVGSSLNLCCFQVDEPLISRMLSEDDRKLLRYDVR